MTVFDPEFIASVEANETDELSTVELLSFFKNVRPDERLQVLDGFLNEYMEFEEEF